MTNLRPTLWRTCRAIANRTRLQMIGHLLRTPNRTVSEVAEEMALSTGTASQYLRLLNARGLLRATRSGRRVTYAIVPDPSIPEVAELLSPLRTTLRRGQNSVETAFRLTTAFTHHRRIVIVRELGQTPLGFLDLVQRTGISRRALTRHLEKLEARGMIGHRGQGSAAVYQLAPCRNGLALVLQRLAREA